MSTNFYLVDLIELPSRRVVDFHDICTFSLEYSTKGIFEPSVILRNIHKNFPSIEDFDFFLKILEKRGYANFISVPRKDW